MIWLVLVLLLALPASASAHGETQALAFADEACGGAPITPTQVITGSFGTDLRGAYVMVPFTVAPGTTQVRVKYCWDAPDSPLALSGHTIDMGLWDARADAESPWVESDFRGWGGSSHPDVQVTAQGFAPGYAPDKRANTPGYTTRGFLPGPVEVGQWAVELGVPAVVGTDGGDSDGQVAWRVEIELSTDPSHDDVPYSPARYDETPVRRGNGWYAGDFHVHAEHSALGDATMKETFGFAFAPRPQGAGLDFITLSDYVTPSAWGEIGRHQDDHPGRLVIRSSEVITYRGHTNNHASLTYVDHRTGPVHERLPDGTLRLQRPARPASEVLRRVRAAGGFTQVNHPTIFPSAVPLFSMLCRGCPWDHTSAETDYRLVDAVEVTTGPAGLQSPQIGPNPFTPLALDFYERALAAGHRIAAVGSSDSHNAGRSNNPVTQAPIGQGTTVVYADELSEDGIARAVRRRHTFVKLYASDRPDLRLEAVVPGRETEPPAIIGDVVRSDRATFTARVLGGDLSMQLVVVKDGLPVVVLPVTGPDFATSFPSFGEGRYRLQLQRGTTIEGVTSPIWLDAGAPPEDFRDGLPRGGPNEIRVTVGRRFRIPGIVTCRARGYALRTCTVKARRRGRTVASGRAPLRGGAARVRVNGSVPGTKPFTVTLVATAKGDRGTVGPVRRKVRARPAAARGD